MFLIVFIFFAITVASAKPVQNFQCGISPNVKTYDGTDQTRILGGKVSNPEDWPFVVKISNGLSFCTATIIGKQWILSAAHCNDEKNPLTITINGKTYKTNDSYIHEKYNATDGYINDIMLIKLMQPLEFSKNVTSICLQNNITAKNGDMAALAGFGRRFDVVNSLNATFLENGIPLDNIKFNRTDLLHEVPVAIRNMEYCFKPEIQSKTKVCAGGEMQGVTQGDSGGPLAIVRNNHWIQYGISSTVRFTGVQGNVNKLTNHGTFTRISAYCDWINQNTNGDVKCQ